jgi:hypothetical protein
MFNLVPCATSAFLFWLGHVTDLACESIVTCKLIFVAQDHGEGFLSPGPLRRWSAEL